MNMQKDGWENDILKDLFSEADVSQILSIPVAETKIADHLIWMGEKKGNFSVSSCYKMLQSNLNDDPVPTWSKMWKLRLPPKVKIFCWQLNTHSLPTYGMLRTKQIYTRIYVNFVAAVMKTVSTSLFAVVLPKIAGIYVEVSRTTTSPPSTTGLITISSPWMMELYAS